MKSILDSLERIKKNSMTRKGLPDDDERKKGMLTIVFGSKEPPEEGMDMDDMSESVEEESMESEMDEDYEMGDMEKAKELLAKYGKDKLLEYIESMG